MEALRIHSFLIELIKSNDMYKKEKDGEESKKNVLISFQFNEIEKCLNLYTLQHLVFGLLGLLLVASAHIASIFRVTFPKLD